MQKQAYKPATEHERTSSRETGVSHDGPVAQGFSEKGQQVEDVVME
jgi:hypothetical protein